MAKLLVKLEYGFVAVPYRGVSLNGIYFDKCNDVEKGAEYSGPWALLSRGNGRALDDEDGRPYLYEALENCREAVEHFKLGEHSTCGGVVEEATPVPATSPVQATVSDLFFAFDFEQARDVDSHGRFIGYKMPELLELAGHCLSLLEMLGVRHLPDRPEDLVKDFLERV